MKPVKFVSVAQKTGGCYAVDDKGHMWEYTASIDRWKKLPVVLVPEVATSEHSPVNLKTPPQPLPGEPPVAVHKRGRGRHKEY